MALNCILEAKSSSSGSRTDRRPFQKTNQKQSQGKSEGKGPAYQCMKSPSEVHAYDNSSFKSLFQ
jgi:hypothetical protein